jgi:hypothetical protein
MHSTAGNLQLGRFGDSGAPLDAPEQLAQKIQQQEKLEQEKQERERREVHEEEGTDGLV